MLRSLLPLLFITLFVPRDALATGEVHSGIDRQLEVRVPREDADIAIDGVLDYPVWEHAAVLAGYGSTVSEPRNLRFRELRRLSDGSFLKFSYLVRL